MTIVAPQGSDDTFNFSVLDTFGYYAEAQFVGKMDGSKNLVESGVF